MAKQTPEEIFRELNKGIERAVYFHVYCEVVVDGNGDPVAVYWDFSDSLQENDHLTTGRQPLSEEEAKALMESTASWLDEQYDKDPDAPSNFSMSMTGEHMLGGRLDERP